MTDVGDIVVLSTCYPTFRISWTTSYQLQPATIVPRPTPPGNLNIYLWGGMR